MYDSKNVYGEDLMCAICENQLTPSFLYYFTYFILQPVSIYKDTLLSAIRHGLDTESPYMMVTDNYRNVFETQILPIAGHISDRGVTLDGWMNFCRQYRFGLMLPEMLAFLFRDSIWRKDEIDAAMEKLKKFAKEQGMTIDPILEERFDKAVSRARQEKGF